MKRITGAKYVCSCNTSLESSYCDKLKTLTLSGFSQCFGNILFLTYHTNSKYKIGWETQSTEIAMSYLLSYTWRQMADRVSSYQIWYFFTYLKWWSNYVKNLSDKGFQDQSGIHAVAQVWRIICRM